MIANRIKCIKIAESQVNIILSAKLFCRFVNKINTKKKAIPIPMTYNIIFPIYQNEFFEMGQFLTRFVISLFLVTNINETT
jgi:hypothetical protein